MYQVIGRRRSSFKPKDSELEIVGWNLYVTSEVDKVEGLSCERLFVTDSKFVSGVVPEVGDFIQVSYNRFGKVAEVSVYETN